jgi:hypothetical protein
MMVCEHGQLISLLEAGTHAAVYHFELLLVPPRCACRRQLCVPGYAMDNGVCSACRISSYGRLTKFGIVVVSVVASLATVIVPLFLLRVGPSEQLSRVLQTCPMMTHAQPIALCCGVPATELPANTN